MGTGWLFMQCWVRVTSRISFFTPVHVFSPTFNWLIAASSAARTKTFMTPAARS